MSERKPYTASPTSPSFPSSDSPTPPGVAVDPLTKSNTTPAVPSSTILKLAFFTVMMFLAPLASYYITLNRVFAGNSTYAGATAAGVANVVLIGYVVVAVLEDQGEKEEREGKKNQ